MKYLNYFIIGTVIIISIISCNSNELSDFSKVVKLKSQKSIKNSKYKRIGEILGISDSIIIVNSHTKEGRLNLINRNDFSIITKVINKGKGPNKIIGPGEMGFHKNSKKIYLVDNGRKKIFIYNLDSLINNNTTPKKIISQPKDIDYISNLEPINDSLFAITGIGKTKNLTYITNCKGDIVKRIGKLPESKWEVKDFHIYIKYMNSISYMKNKDLLIVGYKYYPKLLAYNIEGEKILKKIGPQKFKPFFPGKLVRQKSKVAYYIIESNKNNIFGLYSGKNELSIQNNGIVIESYDKHYPQNILVFSHKGEPLIRIKLDKEISDFIIDKKNKRIIAINPEKETFEVFDISNINNLNL
jgi:hypothetical protein